MDAVGGDGFLFMDPDFTRRYITEIADGLTPALQKLGLVRKNYEHAMLRDNLLCLLAGCHNACRSVTRRPHSVHKPRPTRPRPWHAACCTQKRGPARF